MTPMNIILEIIKDICRNVAYFIETNLKNAATLLEILIPYIMYFIGVQAFIKRGSVEIGVEFLLPFVIHIIIYFLRSYANKIGKGVTVPLPSKRFTEVDDDGEVSINNDRIQELLLYMADLEDHLERKGLL